MVGYVFGVDIGGTSIKFGLFRTDGTILDKWEVKTQTRNNGCEILPDVARSVQQKMKEKGLSKEDVAGLGIGVPGPVIAEREVLAAVNLFWGHKKVAEELEELLGLPIKVGNDANVAALGEMWKGGGRGTKNLIMVTLGTGVGGGIIVDGKIVTGAHGAGGEIGHAAMEPELAEACNCGNHGCLEQFTSATGLVRLARQELARTKEKTVLNPDRISAKDVLDAYKEGDSTAVRVVDEFARYLGNALAIFACVVDPEIFVIGGGVSKAGQPLIDAIRKFYKRFAFAACKETPLAQAELGNDAGIYGAAKLALE